MINELINSYDNFFKQIADNKMLTLLIVAVLALYASMWVEKLSPYTTQLFSNVYFKTIVFILVSYVATSNPVLAIMLAIVLIITLQSIAEKKLNNEVKKLEAFGPESSIKNTLNNDIDAYLENPLERECGQKDVDLTLTNQNEYYLRMIKKGKLIIEKAEQLAKVAIETNDQEKLNIAMNLNSIGKNLALSGYNKLQPAPNGAFVPGVPNPPPLDKYLNFMMSFETDRLRQIYGVLVLKYNELVSMTEPDDNVFVKKMGEMLNTESDLLLEIYNMVKNNISPEKKALIEQRLLNLSDKTNNLNDLGVEINKIARMLL